ncbi:hypothetical protein DSO57_1025164 [Entomophthora muscae]|uniref:Uncharacterized protein n=1 Tax=Entomophthora muscae TaxID=34485 RepID=A0ACC2T2A2_9FUNG|nr:hypothetical protein DSO57_1025164 [Entomophthora muscae]
MPTFQKKKLAWMTILTDPSYVEGAMVLAHSLHATKSEFPLVILVTERIGPEDRKRIEQSSPMAQTKANVSFRPKPGTTSNYASPQFLEAWTKLRVFEMVEYDYVACLDCDMLVISNLDYVLIDAQATIRHSSKWDGTMHSNTVHMMAVHACVCNPLKKEQYPSWWNPGNCAYSSGRSPQDRIAPSSQLQDINILDIDISSAALPCRYINGGMFVISPNLAMAEALTSLVYQIEDLTSFQFAEQDFLSRVFRDHWRALPLAANFLKTALVSHPSLYQLDKIDNIHYIMAKPWNVSPSEEPDPFFEMYELWWASRRQLCD